jgi:hypothetical protein
MTFRRTYTIAALVFTFLLGMAAGYYAFSFGAQSNRPGFPMFGSGLLRIADGIGFEWVGIWNADFGGTASLVSNRTGSSVTYQAVYAFEGLFILNFTSGLGTGQFANDYQFMAKDGAIYLDNYGAAQNNAYLVVRLVNGDRDAWVVLEGTWYPAPDGHLRLSVDGAVPLSLFEGIPHDGYVVDLKDFNCTI